jgi:hypothetical protein
MSMKLVGRLFSSYLVSFFIGCGDGGSNSSSGSSARQMSNPRVVAVQASVDGEAELLEGRLQYSIREAEAADMSELVLQVEGESTALELAVGFEGTQLADGEELDIDFERSNPAHQGSMAPVDDPAASASIDSGSVALVCEGSECTGTLELQIGDKVISGSIEGEMSFVCSSFDARESGDGNAESPLDPAVRAPAVDPDLSSEYCSQFSHLRR